MDVVKELSVEAVQHSGNLVLVLTQSSELYSSNGVVMLGRQFSGRNLFSKGGGDSSDDSLFVYCCLSIHSI